MKLAMEHINRLPAPTWRRLGVNDTAVQQEVPEISPYRGEAFTKIPAGLVLGAETKAMPLFKTGMGDEAVQFAQQNQSCGVAVRVPAGTRVTEPFFLHYILDETNPSVVDFNTIIAEENSEITVVMQYSSAEEIAGFHAGVTRLYAKKNAVIHLVQVQMLNRACLQMDDIGGFAEENAEINVVQAELGAKNVYAGCKVRLDGAESRLNLETIYFAAKDQNMDINYVAEHAGKRTNSEMHVNGALLGNGRKMFRGTIDFLRGSKQAVGHESEYNLLFSPNAHNITVPLILCAEDDVEGQHAATTGKIDNSKLFYLMSRGLDEMQAKKLVIEAQFQPAVERVPQEELRTAIFDYVKERLGEVESLS